MHSNLSIPKLLWTAPAVFLVFLFAFLAGTGSLIGMAFIISAIALFLLVLSGPRFLTILFLVGVPTVFVFPNTVLQAIPVVNMERLLFAGIVGLMMIPVIFKTNRRYPLIRPEKLALAFLGLAFASYVVAIVRGTIEADPIQDGYFFIQYIMGFSAFLIARRQNWEEKSIMQLIDILLFVGCFLAGQAFLQYFLGIDLFVPSYLEIPHAEEGRATGAFANASEFGAIATSFLLLGIYRLGTITDALVRFFLLLVLGTISLAIVLSQTRAPWLAGLLSILLAVVLDTRIRRLLLSFLVAGAIIGIALVPFLVDITELQERFTSLGPLAERLAIWVAAVNMGIQNPLLGIGFGPDSFNTALPRYVIDFGIISAEWASGVAIPHNEFLHIFSLTGIIGAYLYISIIASISNTLFRYQNENKASSNSNRILAGYSLILIFNWVVNGFFVDTGPFWYLVFLVFFFAGVSISVIEKECPDRNVSDVTQ